MVAQNLDWKLHYFDCLFELTGVDSAGAPFESFMEKQYKPQEVSAMPQFWVVYKYTYTNDCTHVKVNAQVDKQDWAAVSRAPSWATDSWGLGCLIYELFSRSVLEKMESLRNVGILPPDLKADYQRLLSSAPSRRLNPAKLLIESTFFASNQLVCLCPGPFTENTHTHTHTHTHIHTQVISASMPHNTAQDVDLPKCRLNSSAFWRIFQSKTRATRTISFGKCRTSSAQSRPLWFKRKYCHWSLQH